MDRAELRVKTNENKYKIDLFGRGKVFILALAALPSPIGFIIFYLWKLLVVRQQLVLEFSVVGLLGVGPSVRDPMEPSRSIVVLQSVEIVFVLFVRFVIFFVVGIVFALVENLVRRGNSARVAVLLEAKSGEITFLNGECSR